MLKVFIQLSALVHFICPEKSLLYLSLSLSSSSIAYSDNPRNLSQPAALHRSSVAQGNNHSNSRSSNIVGAAEDTPTAKPGQPGRQRLDQLHLHATDDDPAHSQGRSLLRLSCDYFWMLLLL